MARISKTNPNKPQPIKQTVLDAFPRSKGMSIQEFEQQQAVDALGPIVEPHTRRYAGGSGFRGGLTTPARVMRSLDYATIEEYDRAQADRERASRDVTGRELAYRNYLRTGSTSGVESRDLLEGATPGSYLVPPTLMGDLIFGVQYFSGVLSRARFWHSVSPGGKPFGGPATLPSIATDVQYNV